jgi:NADH-quinone oxidoreductase subunit G
MANVKLTIDGKEIEAPAGTLVIEAARRAGIEIPSFCYYEGLTLQAACRMCLVEVEKAPKLMTACTLPVAEGMVVRTDTPQVAAARKGMVEFLLTNHPLDCPVCDKGGECELQDMAFRYGVGESRFVEIKYHVPERQWSPVVFYDKPRCILCFRCVRVCDEGLGATALGVVNRGASSEIAPNRGDHLECDQCGMCIDICPVGALTSGTYRYQTRPWEMRHVGTICTHCGDGCKTTLGVRNGRIHRGDNRDRSGINEEFLCVKGRYAGDFTHHPARLVSPVVQGERVSWSRAIQFVAERFKESRRFGIVGSNHTTNEENDFLARFARGVLGTENIDHHRTGDLSSLLATGAPLASTADLYNAPAVVIVGADLSQQHPLLAWQIRANWRHHQARVYVVRDAPVREDKIAARTVSMEAGVESLRDDLVREREIVILFGDAIQGGAVARLVEFGRSLGVPVKYVCLLDYSNSRGAVEFGLLPGPGGLALPQMMAAELDVLWVVGANPFSRYERKDTFTVVQDLFLTETAQAATVALPAASAYEKSGTVTSVCGEVQQLRKAFEVPGTKTDLEIFRLIAAGMGATLPDARATIAGAPEGVRSAGDTLFTSGTLGRYSQMLKAVRG